MAMEPARHAVVGDRIQHHKCRSLMAPGRLDWLRAQRQRTRIRRAWRLETLTGPSKPGPPESSDARVQSPRVARSGGSGLAARRNVRPAVAAPPGARSIRAGANAAPAALAATRLSIRSAASGRAVWRIPVWADAELLAVLPPVPPVSAEYTSAGHRSISSGWAVR